MAREQITPTGRERFFGEDELIVSKTDTRGRLAYANHTFLRISGFTEEEILGQPHSIIRHPDMPRAVFKLLWDTITAGNEIFAYVLNLCKNGDHYWVLAHVTPSRDRGGNIVGYHSSRRRPEPQAVREIAAVYRLLKAEEDRHTDARTGLLRSYELLISYLEEKQTSYERFVFSLLEQSAL